MLRIFCGGWVDIAWLVALDTSARAYPRPGATTSALRGDARACFQVLVRRTVVAVGQWGALARLSLARRRAAARNAAVERAGLDLRLDERARRRDPLAHSPGDLRLRGDREVAPDVLEEGALGLGEVERIGRQTLHRLLACLEHLAAVFDAGLGIDVRIYEILDRAIDRPRVLIHTGLDLHHSFVGNQYPVQPINPRQSFVKYRLILAHHLRPGDSLNGSGPVTNSASRFSCEKTR